jgi:pseudaminic acid biosynthesis-associated methylase
MSEYKTEQERVWSGAFGDDYIGRNRDERIIASNVALFSRIFQHTDPVASLIEFGSNIGLNLKAIERLDPQLKDLSAIEINEKAVAELRAWKAELTVYHQSILDFVPDRQRDFVLIKGVLIHINPATLPTVYDLLYRTSRRYVCLVEYYNPTPVEVSYRGQQGILFKRDFAGELLDRHSDLRLVDYGFVYRRDRFPQDDATWFLLEKREGARTAR